MQAVAVFKSNCEVLSWALAAGSNSVVKLLGDRLNSVVKLLGGRVIGMVSSSWLAALCKQLLCFKSNCEVLGLC